MKYPRYTKKQNLACKLTEKDIEKIRLLREGGAMLWDLAKKFNVSYQLICYWLLSPERRKERNQRQYLLWGKDRDRKDKHTRQSRHRSRKWEAMPEFRKYKREIAQRSANKPLTKKLK